ncbi:hypothetical protein D3C87_1996310 [compost metagenome]
MTNSKNTLLIWKYIKITGRFSKQPSTNFFFLIKITVVIYEVIFQELEICVLLPMILVYQQIVLLQGDRLAYDYLSKDLKSDTHA